MSRTILVTGAGGYIGSVATYLLLQNGYKVVAVDNFSTGYRQPLEFLQDKFGKDKLTNYEFDLRHDLTPLFEEEKNIDAVIHYAASCLVDESVKDPAKYFSNNVCGTLNLLNTMLNNKVNKIIFSSTCAVYGEAEYFPIDEKHSLNPTAPYGESKLMTEKIIQWYGKLKGLKYIILRYFNVCGATDDGEIGDSKKPSTLLVQNAVRGTLGIESFYLTYPEVPTPDKSPIRDFVNVVDLNNAHLKALEYLFNKGNNEIINLGTGNGDSVLEIVNKVEEVTGHKLDLKKSALRAGDDAKKIADIKKAQEVLGWKPEKSIKDGIESLVKWYKKHPKGWENNMIAGIILAAGRGTRIKSTTNNKVTLPFLNKPMIMYGVEFLSQVASPLVVVVGAFADSVKEVLKKYNVAFAHQRDQLGTAHAVAAGLEELDGKIDPHSLVLVGYGDHMMFYSVKNANDLISYHKKQQAVMTLVTTVLDDPHAYGRIIRDATGNVEAIVEEKDATDEQKKIKEINAGLYCFNYRFLKENISGIEKSAVSGEYYLTDLVKIGNCQGKTVCGFEVEFKNVGIGINKPEELEESQKIYLKNNPA